MNLPTRSASHHDHRLQTPETFVRAPLPGMRNATAIVHTSPAGGSAFVQYTAEFEETHWPASYGGKRNDSGDDPAVIRDYPGRIGFTDANASPEPNDYPFVRDRIVEPDDLAGLPGDLPGGRGEDDLRFAAGLDLGA